MIAFNALLAPSAVPRLRMVVMDDSQEKISYVITNNIFKNTKWGISGVVTNDVIFTRKIDKAIDNNTSRFERVYG